MTHQGRTPLMDKVLEKIYLNPKDEGSFGGLERLFKSARRRLPGLTHADVESFLKRKDSYTLHVPVRRRYPRNKIFASFIDHQWEADLVDMQSFSKTNDGFKYLLTVVDVLSKYAWAEPIKNKDGIAVALAFSKIFKNKRIPERIHTDKGREFFNKKVAAVFKKNKVKHFASDSDMKAAIAERFNRTLKARMWRYFTEKNTRRWVDVVHSLVGSYNNSLHRSTGFAPSMVSKDNELTVFRRLYGYGKSSIGDNVRISKQRAVFDKGYLPGWTEEVFTVAQAVPNTRTVYKLKDLKGEEISGGFYPEEIQKVYFNPNAKFKIEKTIKRRKNPTTGRKELFVKWLGWPNKFNSWIDEGNVTHK